MVHNYPLLIREAHLDTFGHVNNAVYLSLYEEARWQLVTENGYDLKYVQKSKKGPVILEVNVKFMRELKLREQITITTELVKYEKLVGVLKQQVLKADGTVASEAIFTFGLFDMVERKLIPPTPEWKKAVGLTL